jgi:cytochrome c2
MNSGPLFVVLLATSVIAVGQSAAADPGNADRGRAIFAAKQCARCHLARSDGAGAGPAVEDLRRPQGEMELAGRLWNHVPAMFASLSTAGAEWPPITIGEMADLMAFLMADPARDRAADVAKGRVVLMRKGCLKCHSLRREGGPVRPDLAERRADYESAAAWAATMWTHTPRMADMATRRGIAYPRFSGDEMVNLLGLLRSAALSGGASRGEAPAKR